MPDITQASLPGIGVRYEFTTEAGDRIGVVCHHTGRREIVVYDDADPDVAHRVANLSAQDSRSLAEILGANQISEAIATAQQRIEGLALDWIEVSAASPLAGHTIASGELRTRTGVSVVATVGEHGSNPAPGPEDVLSAGDTVVVVGTPEGIEAIRALLRP